MNLQFGKKSIPYLRTIKNGVESREQTQEVRLTDGMPDIGYVLSCWGQVLIRGKEWHTGGIAVNGGVMAWVLYMPDDGSQPQCVETWLPFQMKWDFEAPTQDGAICVQPSIVSVDARSTSARKIMVRACIDVLAQAKIKDTAEIGIPEDLPENICILQNTYPMMLPAEGGEKPFSLEEVMELQFDTAQINKILYYNLSTKVTEQKLLTDKLIFRGIATLKMLYMEPDGKLCSWTGDVPFSQYAELDQDYTEHAESSVCVVVTNLELDKTNEGKLVLKAGLLGQYTIFDRINVTVVEDAYSLKHKLRLQTENLNLPAVLDTVTETVRVQHPVGDGSWLPADVEFYPALPRMYRDETGIGGDLSGVFHVLGCTDDSQLNGVTFQWSDSWNLPVDPGVKTEIQLQSGRAGVDNGNATAELHLTVRLLADQNMSAVTGLELYEDAIAVTDRPSLILRRKGELSLWELAKMAGSTVEAIECANDLLQEPAPDKMLLIPVF